jgi:1-acyl-sn-glycerol-3-phosphate acyltransferase
MARIKPYAILPWIIQRGVLVFFVKPLYYSFLDIEVLGLKNIPLNRNNYIFASNHSSELDPTIIPAVLPIYSRFVPMFYVSKDRSFYDRSGWRKIFYGGLIFKLFGAYPVISGVKNYGVSMERHIKILKDGYSIHIFPEGVRTLNGEIGEGRGGISYLSLKSGIPIIPVSIKGFFKLSIKDFFSDNRKIIISFGSPIYLNSNFSVENDVLSHKSNASFVINEIKSLFNYSA